ncbi:T9SS type A sorting domain-containing protein [Dyadobacter chenwenxiniae]|uniref:T9SS type A sorting domain-containing protein n=1 Tax=Dyadobacter chenwenxiniae TaxID=2906456 RepID=A0A9X1TDB6_9BACT|nr:T9SS type A sorting domain-containing protein [Dyadobacter chenwenxiniae]MCF0061781.1 T9SS type A sorting domain-containing protein [Dyadobacter chenwenxiniae]UON81598.1 T9SS type A sorting domain-containing protein [Dyadobacter chenwenxiniae]
MKKDFHSFRNSIILTSSMMLFSVLNSFAQEAFKIKWSMDYIQSGVSNHANFIPADAVLAGGGNTNALNAGYGLGGATVAAYVVRPWPNSFSDSRYMEFKFTAKSFKYNITSISLRLRRSPDGPKQFKIRTSMDGFASDLTASTLVNPSQFYTFSVPAGFNNLSENTFTFRIYGYGPTSIYGTLWFDEIVVNGDVLAIVLPVYLTYFKATAREGKTLLSWETTWERNSRHFLIERSADLSNFEEIGTLPASGETDGRTRYGFTDPAPLPGINYYRLQMIDAGGKSAFSCSANVLIQPASASFCIVPNPASATKISVFGKNMDAESFELRDLTGLRIVTKLEFNAQGFVDIIPVRPLLPGLYLLSCQTNGRKEHAKVLVR